MEQEREKRPRNKKEGRAGQGRKIEEKKGRRNERQEVD